MFAQQIYDKNLASKSPAVQTFYCVGSVMFCDLERFFFLLFVMFSCLDVADFVVACLLNVIWLNSNNAKNLPHFCSSLKSK